MSKKKKAEKDLTPDQSLVEQLHVLYDNHGVIDAGVLLQLLDSLTGYTPDEEAQEAEASEDDE